MKSHVDDHFAGYLNGSLTLDLRHKVDAHLNDCDKCRTKFNKIRFQRAQERRQALKRAGAASPAGGMSLRGPGGASGGKGRAVKMVLLLALLIGGVYWIFPDLFERLSTPTEQETPLAPPEEPAEPKATPPREAAVPKPKPQPDPVTPVEAEPAPAVPATNPPATAVERGKEWRGTFSAIDRFREVVVRDRTLWTKLWRELGQGTTPPDVDFSKDMVVGVLLGRKPTAGFSVAIVDFNDTANQGQLTYRVTETPAGTPVSQTPTSPFHLRVVPGTIETVTFVVASN